MNKRIITALITSALTVSMTAPALACYGVRAMGMGGAFIAVADDVQSVYWNPAGLAFLEKKEVAWHHLMTDRKYFNYLDEVEYVTPLDDGKSGIGFHYTKDRATSAYWPAPNLGFKDYKQDWYVMSYGTKLSDNVAVGINVRNVQEKTSLVSYNGSLYSGMSADNTGIDVSVLAKDGKWSYGLLIQDVNEPDALFGASSMIQNWRPAVAYRPDQKTIVAVDAYNFTEEGHSDREYSIGAEHKVNDKFRVRIGNYHGSMTYGAGYQATKDVEINIAHLAGQLESDQIGVQYKF